VVKYLILGLAGVVGGTLFWLLGTAVFTLPQGYLLVGMAAWFCAFAAGGFFSLSSGFPEK